MPGDEWQQFANLRMLYGYQYTMPGKKLLFMGSEFAQREEWDADGQLDWELCVYPRHDGIRRFIGDLNRRRAIIKSQEAGATGVRVKADAPLSEMFGYIGDLRTITSGRGQFSMEFSHYADRPASVAEKVIAEVQERKEAA